MKPYLSDDAVKFLTPSDNEEALDQPLYDIKSYAAAGVSGNLNFFADTQAGNGYQVTNLDSANILSRGKRFMVFGIGVAWLTGANPVQSNVTGTPQFALQDAQAVLEGSAYLSVQILDKVYLVESPLIRVPAGIGLFTGAGGIQETQASGATGVNAISYANNGLPFLGAMRKLRVPLPIPEQVRFTATINFPSAITVTVASRIGIWLDGMLIRARQ